jgi:hypothetical protein
MRKAIAGFVVMGMLLGVPAVALDGPEAHYLGGTAPGVKEGSTGTLDTTLATALEFHAVGAGFSIPYTGVKVYKYKEENRFRLGVLPAIAVGMLKARSKRHLVTISWKDASGVSQVVTPSKDDALGLMALLRARSTQACKVKVGPPCADGE